MTAYSIQVCRIGLLLLIFNELIHNLPHPADPDLGILGLPLPPSPRFLLESLDKAIESSKRYLAKLEADSKDARSIYEVVLFHHWIHEFRNTIEELKETSREAEQLLREWEKLPRGQKHAP